MGKGQRGGYVGFGRVRQSKGRNRALAPLQRALDALKVRCGKEYVQYGIVLLYAAHLR